MTADVPDDVSPRVEDVGVTFANKPNRSAAVESRALTVSLGGNTTVQPDSVEVYRCDETAGTWSRFDSDADRSDGADSRDHHEHSDSGDTDHHAGQQAR